MNLAAALVGKPAALARYAGMVGYRKYTNKIRNPRGEGGVVGTVGVLNKCTGYNAKPTNTAAFTFGAPITMALADDTAALTTFAASDVFVSAGFQNSFLSGNVLSVTNSDPTTERRTIFSGVTGNTNPHSMRILMRVVGGTARVSDSVSGSTIGSASTSSASYVWLTANGFTPSSSSTALAVHLTAGAIAYFILFDLIEASTAAPVPTVVAGAAATGALPTNMSISNGLTYGLSLAFLGRTTVQGLPAFQVRYIGTANASNTIYIGSDANTYAAAAAGQAWGADFLVSLANGSMNGATVKSVMSEYAGASYLRTLVIGANVAPTIVPSRVSSSGVAISSTITSVNHFFGPNVTNTTVYDFTLNFIAPKLVQLAVIEGAELVTNGDFASATGWTLGSGWSISGGVLVAASPPGGSLANAVPSPAMVSGSVYKVAYSIVTATSGASVSSSLGSGAVNGSIQSTAASYTDYLIANATNAAGLYGRGAGTFAGTIDNFSVKLVTAGYMPAFPILPPVGVPGDSSSYAAP